MTEKLVHVNSYTKKDGTKVKEHFREINIIPQQKYETIDEGYNDPIVLNYEEDDTPIVLVGGISKTGDMEGGNIGDIAETVLDVITNVLGIINNLTNSSGTTQVTLEKEFNNQFQHIKNVQTASQNMEKEYLKKLVETKDKQEYANLYKHFTQQKALNEKNNNTIAKIEYAVQNKDYNNVAQYMKELEGNWENSFYKPMIKIGGEVFNNQFISTPIQRNIMNKYLDYKRSNKDIIPYIAEDKLHDKPELQKMGVSTVMKSYKVIHNAPDADALWQIAANGFEKNAKYIQENGQVIENINQLPSDIKNFVQKKLQQQLQVDNSKGILYKPNSNLAKEIANCPEMQNFLIDNLSHLANGESVTGSTYFESSENLNLSLGHADIYNAHIDANGNLVALVIDTYDFNKNDPDWKVHVARNIQDEGLIINYYEIIPVIIPKEVLLKYFDYLKQI